jgi:serine/threonine protein kinase
MGNYRAVKVLRRNRFDDHRPFEREYEGLRRFEPLSRRHPGWVPILQIGPNPIENYFYYVMEAADDMVSGRAIVPKRYIPKTLERDLAARGRFRVDECVQLGLTLVDALGELHKAGFVHRDVKPSNIIYIEGVPKLADIGLVTGLAGGTRFIGSEAYMPRTTKLAPAPISTAWPKFFTKCAWASPFLRRRPRSTKPAVPIGCASSTT